MFQDHEMTTAEWAVWEVLGTTGMDNRGIAKSLGIKASTVSTHMKRVLSKLRLSNRTKAALAYKRHGTKLKLVRLENRSKPKPRSRPPQAINKTETPVPVPILASSDAKKIQKHVEDGGAWNKTEPGEYVK